jgi:hypothetical protein
MGASAWSGTAIVVAAVPFNESLTAIVELIALHRWDLDDNGQPAKCHSMNHAGPKHEGSAMR